VLPTLTAGDPPRVSPADWKNSGNQSTQFAITLDGIRIGTIWTIYRVDETSVLRNDLVWIEYLKGLPIAPLRVTVDSVFTPDGLLDELTVRLRNDKSRDYTLHGERFHSDFSFSFETGPQERTFKVPLTDGSLLTGGFNSFSRLAGIKVGQHWRVQVFNPVSVLTGLGPKFLSVLVTVTGKESIATKQGTLECFVVESTNGKAWVDGDGEVVKQEIALPISGTLRLEREQEFDQREEAFRRNYSFP
jgi:hypothetical protein